MTSKIPSIAAFFCVLAIACGSHPSSEAAPGDASVDTTSSLDDSSDDLSQDQCVPCFQTCVCEPGETFYATSACVTYTCPASGSWGPLNCTGRGCPEAAGEEASTEHDAASDGPTEAATDSASDAPTDGPIGDAGQDASDAGGDALADAPAD